MTDWAHRLLADKWFHALLANADPDRIHRAEDYVRRQALLEATVEPGVLRALVKGSRTQPYEAVIVAPLVDKVALERATVPLLAELLTTHPDPMAMDELVAAVPELVPEPDALHFNCSCPDWASPCKHVIALGLVFGDLLDGQVGFFLRFRGLDTLTLLHVMTELEYRRLSTAHPRRRPDSGARTESRPSPGPLECPDSDDRPTSRPSPRPLHRSDRDVRPPGHRVDPHEFWHGSPLPDDGDFHILNGADRAPEALLAPPLPWPRSNDDDPPYLDVISLIYDRMRRHGSDDPDEGPQRFDLGS